ncbi:hypothetical protein DNTS_006004, partial [Danionella cerebrum]
SKYQCPVDFKTMPFVSAASALLEGNGQELWLIKAPARFDPKCFENLKLPLSGMKMVQSSGISPQTYSILSSRAPTDLHLLASDRSSQKPFLCSSGFSGILKISETYGNSGEDQGLLPIPATPAPCIPNGLKQRFQPFGSLVTVVSDDVPERTRDELSDCDDRKKRKKKKKKDKRREDSEEVLIKQEVIKVEYDQYEHCEQTMVEEPTKERRKKKKLKKEKTSEDEDVFDAGLIKTESVDNPCDNIETPEKLKKKKKKRCHNE